MAQPLLVIGNKNLSSWSMRPWLAMRAASIDFAERVLPMDTPVFKTEMKAILATRSPVEVTPPRKVPLLLHDGVTIWESLAICEYAAEVWAPALWPTDQRARAQARAVSHEMHAGFTALRRACPMNLKADLAGTTLTPEAGGDVHRILEIWRECRARFGEGGPFLFGAFSIADAMFAPVVTRFLTYGIPADDSGQQYMNAVQALPAFIEWRSAALLER